MPKYTLHTVVLVQKVGQYEIDANSEEEAREILNQRVLDENIQPVRLEMDPAIKCNIVKVTSDNQE